MFKALLGLSVVLMLSGCSKLNNMFDMPDKMDKLTEKIDTTNGAVEKTNDKMKSMQSALHKQVLLTAIQEASKPGNMEMIFPIPTGLMPSGKAFAESANAQEIMDFVYITMREIEEVNPLKGIDKDGNPLPLTDADLDYLRANKLAKLYALMVIAGFTPDQYDRAADLKKSQENKSAEVEVRDDTLSQIIDEQINQNGRHYDTAMAFMALRGYFLREVLLKLSLKVDPSAAETLHTKGLMEDALKYLVKLDQVSKASFETVLPVRPAQFQVHLHEKQYNLLVFDEVQDVATQKETAKTWSVALKKAQSGMNDFANQMSENSKQTEAYAKLVRDETAIVNTMQSYVDSWKQIFP